MILLLTAHPHPQSFNHALAVAVGDFLGGQKYLVHTVNLYNIAQARENNSEEERPNSSNKVFPAIMEKEELLRKTSFNPIVQEQMALVEEAEAYVVVHPDWWGGPPAVLKGWIDRVLRPETAYTAIYEDGKIRFEGLLGGRQALVIITGDGNVGPLKPFWEERVWQFCGVQALVCYISSPGKTNKLEKQRKIEETLKVVKNWLRKPDIRA